MAKYRELKEELTSYEAFQINTYGNILTEDKCCFHGEEHENGMRERDRQEDIREQMELQWLMEQEF